MNNDSIQAYLPQPVEVTDELIEDYVKRGQIPELVIQLYREAGVICTISAGAYRGDSGQAMDRNQAICCGLLVRIAKFMLAVIDLTTGTERGEVIIALNRSISESVINLMFLISKNDHGLYDKYVAASLSTEREFYDLVKKNIGQRGETLKIEESILESILRVAKLSGTHIEQVDPKFRDWSGGLRQRYEALGQPDRYVTESRMGSHAVHGTWVDLIHHHLHPVDNGFVPNFEWTNTDGELLAPVAFLALDAAHDYLTAFFKDVDDCEVLVERIENLEERILKVEFFREDWSSTE